MPRFDPADAPRLIRAARLAAGTTQREFAAALGIAQPNLAAIESGKRVVSAERLAQLLEAAGYRPSVVLPGVRAEVLEAAAKYGFSNVRVFGSVAAGADDFGSDIDLLVDAVPVTSLFEVAWLMDEVERLTGFPADVLVDHPGDEFIERVRSLAESL